MKIVISNRSELPIYAQIAAQIREQILDGRLSEGTTLPSIRKLAKEVGVSVITTARAYSDLEQAGFIASIQGKGTVVLPQDNSRLRAQALQRIEAALAEAVSAARVMNLSRSELYDLLDAQWRAGNG